MIYITFEGVDVGGDAPLYLGLLGVRGWSKVTLRNQTNRKVTFCLEIQHLKLSDSVPKKFEPTK